MKKIILLLVCCFTSMAFAKKVISCSLYDLPTDQILAVKEAELVKNAPTNVYVEYIDVKGTAVDRPIENGLREQILVAENTLGEQAKTLFRYSLKTVKPSDFPYAAIEYPGLGDTILFKCIVKDESL